jgi:DNA processing protein
MDRDEQYLWLLLARLSNGRQSLLRGLLKRHSDPRVALHAPIAEWRAAGADERALQSLAQWRRRGRQAPAAGLAREDQDRLTALGAAVLPYASPTYPARLREIHDPPGLLYLRGDAAALACPQLAVVGARRASGGGRRAAADLAGQLAALGFGICSGLALGIDSVAHQAALDVDGVTVAVMATGIDRVYPARHAALAEAICERGALVSEAPPGTAPRREGFPARNRLISGLSLGVLVVEAAVRSGSLITARLALEQNREVFALPHSIYHPLGRGCHQLINQGARLVESVADILEEIRLVMPSAAPVPVPEDDAVPGYPGRLLEALGYAPATVNDLVSVTGDTVTRVMEGLTELQVAGRVECRDGRYQRL